MALETPAAGPTRGDGSPAPEGAEPAAARGPEGDGGPVPRGVRTVAAYAWAFVGVALAVVALSYAIARLYVVVLPVIVAFFLAALLGGPAGWLRRRGLPSWAATVLVLALFAVVLIGLAIFVEQRVVAQFAAVDFGVSRGLDRLEQLFAGLQIVSSEQIAETVAAAKDQFLSAPAPPGGERPNALLTGATTGFTVFAGTLLAAFVLFFFLLEGERLWRAFVDVWPARRRADVDAIGRRAWGALQAYLRGITLVALFNSVMLGLALAVIGVPLVYSLSIVMFLATFIPVVGSYLAGAVAALIALVFKDATDALVVLGAVVVIQQIEGNLFYPLVVGRRVRLHPVVIVLALSVGATLAGITGALVAVPLAAMVAATASYFRTRGAPAPASARG